VIVFGSAQLATHPHFRPKAIHDKEILDEFSHDYMYFDYVQYINSVSPIIHSIFEQTNRTRRSIRLKLPVYDGILPCLMTSQALKLGPRLIQE
jgi:hypothetical protein